MRIATSDIGGTHARFAIATIDGSRVAGLSEPLTLKTSEYPDFQSAWEEFGRRTGEPLPDQVAIAFAGPVGGEVLKLTNSAWVIRPALIAEQLGVERFVIVNDFGAVAHAVAAMPPEGFRHLCGPDRPLAGSRVTTIVGPGTGLGVAALLRDGEGGYSVVETEGGHIDFAPRDRLDDLILEQLRQSFGRVSVERIVSGPGLANIYKALSAIEKTPVAIHDDKQLWVAAMDGSDRLAAAALDRFCLALGAVSGDMALAHGASSVVIAGGLGLRIADQLARSGFCDRFVAKGRFERRMDEMPVKLIAHPQPGLLGAAAAFAQTQGVAEVSR